MGNSSAHRKAQILLTFFLGIIFSFRVACSLFNWHRFRHTYTFRQSCVHIVSFVLPFGTMQFMRRISRKIEVSAVSFGANGLPRILPRDTIAHKICNNCCGCRRFCHACHFLSLSRSLCGLCVFVVWTRYLLCMLFPNSFARHAFEYTHFPFHCKYCFSFG